MSYNVLTNKINVLESTKGAIKNGQSWETDNIGYTRRRKTNQKHNRICVEYHYAQRNTNNENKTWALLQTTGGNSHHFSYHLILKIAICYISLISNDWLFL